MTLFALQMRPPYQGTFHKDIKWKRRSDQNDDTMSK